MCEDFKRILQAMMDQREIEFSEKVIEESVNVIIDVKFMEGSSFEEPKLLTIFFENDPALVANTRMHQPKLIIEVPSHFSNTDNKMVLWNYNCNSVHEAAAANILGIGGMT